MNKYTDEHIIDGFRTYDADITKEFFYGYCRKAYAALDSKYNLRNKLGLDFYSLAHEYYLQLLQHDFKPLMDRPQQMRLSTFMYKGFWFVAMDALKAYNKEFAGTTDLDDIMYYVRSTDSGDRMMEQVAEAVTRHYHDRTMSHLAWSLFVMGYKQNEVSAELGMTPSAVNQRYKKMMEEVVTPFVIENYGRGRDVPLMLHACIVGGEISECSMTADFDDFMPLEKSYIMENRRITPQFITSLQENEVFVFGSNLRGIHAGGAARTACLHFGAEMGKGVGMQGQSYAIPTMQGGVETIRPYVNDFIAYAQQHPEQHFLVTPIGCGIAGFEPSDIAPLFRVAKNVENISLPESFWDEL